MKTNPELIVMLTYNDCTVNNAYEIFNQCKNSKAKFWGMKEKPLPLEKMQELYSYFKQCGKTTFLEVVSYTEKECMEGAITALQCKCDILMGTLYFDSINEFCQKNGLKYMPFIGTVTKRPSILEGDIEDMISKANMYLEKGVYGFDLLGYRYTGDCVSLINNFVSQVPAPVIVAGSINSYQRLNEVKKASPWAFTIGSAFFDNKFNGTFEEQINTVCEYMEKN